MKIALYGQILSRENAPYCRNLIEWFKNHNLKVLIYKPFNDHLKEHWKIDTRLKTFERHKDLLNGVDCMLSVGGDGTMLNALLLVRDSGIPLAGINLGRLGFLSSIPKEHWDVAMQELVARKYSLDPRTLVTVESDSKPFGSDNFALNEVTLLKKGTSAMIRIDASINGEFFNSYWADGLIISTPTGSTGYSLSCGGPIILPESDSLVLTPIAPHNLNVRPVVIPDVSEISLRVDSRTKNFLLSLDSRSYSVKQGEEIRLRKTGFSINLVRLERTNFTSTLRNKLLWGIDKRN